MYNSRIVAAFAASTVLLIAGASAGLAQTAIKTIGVIDRDKVVSGFPKAQHAAEQLKKGEESVQKLVESANKQYDEAKKASKSPAELEGMQRQLQVKIDSEVKKLQAQAQQLEGQLESEIEGAIKAEASAAKVDVVIMKQAVLLGGTDLTEGVVKRLAAANKPTGATK